MPVKIPEPLQLLSDHQTLVNPLTSPYFISGRDWERWCFLSHFKHLSSPSPNWAKEFRSRDLKQCLAALHNIDSFKHFWRKEGYLKPFEILSRVVWIFLEPAEEEIEEDIFCMITRRCIRALENLSSQFVPCLTPKAHNQPTHLFVSDFCIVSHLVKRSKVCCWWMKVKLTFRKLQVDC